MKIIVNGEVNITLPDFYITAGDGRTCNIETSFLSEFKSRLSKKGKINQEERLRAFCLSKISTIFNKQHKSHFEIMGGVGVTASILSKDGAEVSVNELDKTCVEVLRKNFPTWNIDNQDMFEYNYTRNYDSIFLDYNNFTLKKHDEVYRKITDEAFAHSDKFVVINDCSVFYLSRGSKSFEVYSKLLGVPIHNMEDYFNAVKVHFKKIYPEWDITNVVWFHATSYLVFSKSTNSVPKNLVIERVCTDDEIKSPVLELEYTNNDKGVFIDSNKGRLYNTVIGPDGVELLGSVYLGGSTFAYVESGFVNISEIGNFGKVVTQKILVEHWEKLKELGL